MKYPIINFGTNNLKKQHNAPLHHAALAPVTNMSHLRKNYTYNFFLKKGNASAFPWQKSLCDFC